MAEKRRILIVDDSPVVLVQLQDEFATDYDVITAESGEEAVAILEDSVRDGICFSNLFDLIITDLLMPGMNGFELAEYVRKQNKVNRFTPVILLTTEKISKEKARQCGCAAYFSKADKKRLIGMVRILLSV
ncbi:MAG: response regulator [Desulfuromonadales bacterium]|nr:response regulator [Desulfuromonadales bacterium]